MEEINTTNQTERSEKNSKKPRKKRIVLWIILGILALALIGGGIYVWHVLKRPDVFFDPSVRVNTVQTPEPTPAIDIKAYLPTQEPGTTPIPTAAIQPTQTPTEQPETDTTPTGIVNIALFGIDAYEDGSSTSGSMPHTDANMIVAINFDTKEVSLISIARDCMTTAPGYRGFYKFNGIFNVGGGMTDPKAGFALSCRAAEEWLGGISVPYYYGVDFQALIDLVDLIGGIDFDVDIKLYLMDGRRIFPGHRHLDGQGVMAYMRMRKTAGGLDSKRTARQRKMIVAIFKKLKQEGKLSMIPDLLKRWATTFIQTRRSPRRLRLPILQRISIRTTSKPSAYKVRSVVNTIGHTALSISRIDLISSRKFTDLMRNRCGSIPSRMRRSCTRAVSWRSSIWQMRKTS